MSIARSNQFKQTEKLLLQTIEKKIYPLNLAFLEQITGVLNQYIEKLNKQFSLNDQTVKEMEARGLKDWSHLYTEKTPFLFIEILFTGTTFDHVIPRAMHLIRPFIDAVRNVDGKAFEKELNKEGLEKQINLLIIAYRLMLLDSACGFINGKMMHQLIAEAKNGSDQSLFKAIAIDKSLITSEWVSHRIRKESLKSNLAFFKELSKALNKTLDIKKTYSMMKQTIFLTSLWAFSVKLTDPEICLLLKKLDIYDTNPETLRVTRNRLGLTHSSNKKINWLEMLQQKPTVL